MHITEAPDHRQALVVERDWVADQWVVTRSVSATDGRVLAVTRSEYPCDLFDATDVEEIVYGLLPGQ